MQIILCLSKDQNRELTLATGIGISIQERLWSFMWALCLARPPRQRARRPIPLLAPTRTNKLGRRIKKAQHDSSIRGTRSAKKKIALNHAQVHSLLIKLPSNFFLRNPSKKYINFEEKFKKNEKKSTDFERKDHRFRKKKLGFLKNRKAGWASAAIKLSGYRGSVRYIYIRTPVRSTAATFCIREILSWGLFRSSAGGGIYHGGLLHQHHSLSDEV